MREVSTKRIEISGIWLIVASRPSRERSEPSSASRTLRARDALPSAESEYCSRSLTIASQSG